MVRRRVGKGKWGGGRVARRPSEGWRGYGKTLAFTYLNPHVYSDTVFFLGNFSKNFPINYKIYFGIGGSIASFLFFYLLGYLANYFSKYLNNVRAWVVIKWIISLIMSLISIYVIFEILKFLIRKSVFS